MTHSLYYESSKKKIHKETKKTPILYPINISTNEYGAHYKSTGPEIWNKTCGQNNPINWCSGTGVLFLRRDVT